MRIRFPLFLIATCLLAGCATPSPKTGVAVMTIGFPKQKNPERVVIELNDSSAPGTSENFRTLIARHYYDGMRFHRVFPHQLVQTGDPKSRHGEVGNSGTGGPGYTLPPEIRLKAEKGAVAAARLPDTINPARLSNGSQFFICLSPMPRLNGQYTVFGRVIEGLEVLDRVSASPADSNDFPSEKVVIKSIRLE
jgi:cyclophilin family peptidyl-prolyl cis-trans isomerase